MKCSFGPAASVFGEICGRLTAVEAWSRRQGDVYPASFAAVPHVVEALARDPAGAGNTYFHFPAWVEICRVCKGLTAPDDLRQPYFAALARLPGLAAAAAAAPWDDDRLACVLCAIAAAKGHCETAKAVLESYPTHLLTEFSSGFESSDRGG